MQDQKCIHKTLWLENLKGRDPATDIGTNGRIILKWMFWKQGPMALTLLRWPGVRWWAVVNFQDPQRYRTS